MPQSPNPAPGAPRSALILAFSVINVLVAAALLAWVLAHNSVGANGQSPASQPTVVGISVSPTSVAVVLPSSTSTPQPLPPTETPVPPLPTDTPVPALPTSIIEIATATFAPPPPIDTFTIPTAIPTVVAVQPTLTAAALPFTGTPPPSPTVSQPLPPPTETPLPPPPPTIAPPSPTRPGPVIVDVPYYVRPGDTLSSLAARFHTTVNAIMLRNGLRTTTIHVGQYLIIPDP